MAKDSATDAADLLTHYSFDLGGYTVDRLMGHWTENYPAHWVRLAIVEALYQGRYKAISVEQILTLWRRRGQPIQHFNHDFERMICGKFPKSLTASSEMQAEEASFSNLNLIESSNAFEIPSSNSSDAAKIPDINITPTLPHVIGDRSDSPQPADLTSFKATESRHTEVDLRLGEVPIQTFKPATGFQLDPIERINFSRSYTVKHPIDQFVPANEPSEFYVKLKAVAQSDGRPEIRSLNVAVFTTDREIES